MPVEPIVLPHTAPAAVRAAPDPTAKLAQLPGTRVAANQYAVRALHRRGEIYAATRRLIADRGLAKVTIRLIAQESETSVQTLYNLVGDRERIMVEAIKEHVGVLAGFSAQCAEYPNPIVALADAYHATCTVERRYALNTLSTQSTTRIFSPEIERYVVGVYAGYLKTLAQNGQLRGSVDVPALSRRIVLYSIATIVDWGARGIPLAELRNELITGVSCLLLHGLGAGAAEDLERWLDTQTMN